MEAKVKKSDSNSRLGLTLLNLLAAAFILAGIAHADQGSLGNVDFQARFGQWQGIFLMILPNGDTIAYHPERCADRLPPCSTFKLPNSMIALETGILHSVSDTIKWDGVTRNISSWNRDHTLETAFQNSVVWYYQEVARRVGRACMQHFLDTLHYGNHTIGNAVDQFWLDGSLRISPCEQLDFVRRWARGNLPFSSRTQDLVRQISIVDSTAGIILRGKTGTGIKDRPSHPDTVQSKTLETNLGWFVGYVERNSQFYPFVLNIQGRGATGATARQIAVEILQEMNFLPRAED